MAEIIPLREIYREPSILVDCWEGKESFRSLVPWHFSDERSFIGQAERLEKRAYRRRLLVEVLGEQNAAFSGGKEAARNLDMLADPRCLVVIGGQQAGLFGGPLYTMYKGMTVISLAARLSSVLRRPVVPLFWIASEDGDLAEVNHAHVIDKEGVLSEVSLDGDVQGRIPVSSIPLGNGIGEALTEVRASLSDSPFAQEVMEELARIHTPNATYPGAFGAWMASCLGDRGLVMVDPSDERLKRVAEPLFRREIEEGGAVARAVLRQTARMTALGYPQQLELHEGMLTLFYQDPQRQAIGVNGGVFELKGRSETFARAELLSLLEKNPRLFSPNAALRPLFQDTIFPTVATVLGPAELAYHCQLTEAYSEAGIPMPVLFPRASLTLVEPKIAKLMDRHGVDLLEVIRRGEGILDDFVKKEIPSSLFESLKEGKARVDAVWNGLIREIEEFDPTLAPTAKNTLGTISKRFEHMEGKIMQAARGKDRTLREHARRLTAALYPRGGLQERTLGVVSFLARYGKSFLDLLYAEIQPFSPGHRIVRMAP